MSEKYDLVIIGGGPGGMAAGIYAARSKLKTVILEEKPNQGGQCYITEEIENYPGFPESSGPALTEAFQKHAEKFGVEFKRARAEKIELVPNSPTRIVHGSDGVKYECLAVVVATGASARELGCKGEKEHWGKGVSYCATCDGAFFEECEIVVIGGGDSAVEEAMYLTKFADKVTIVHRRDELRAAKSIQDKAFANPKMAFKWNAVVEEVCGEGLVDSVILKDTKTGETSKFDTEGVFVFIGHNPQTAFIQGLVDLDENGYILTNGRMETNVPGIYGVGDVIQKESRQVVTAAADGALAGIWAGHYIDDIKAKMAMNK
ncbi:thioredoxin-disulfide reductase [Treponema sp. OMZ 787]|uniref:thioredoxin-disulfide reductase n=1 Tax=Treponema sp. OMZ 787 TaxID=2563669 RepID=UPI0020A29663|nr:thioredoxin-disulfide reductase [Treponema sp. OMZ 787]UTC62967.1 thioredoxin-disulfide reductase [Treponema sp. OMZ 787]